MGEVTETNPDGRGPNCYCTPELIERVWEYVKDSDIAGDEVPTVSGLSIYLGIARKTFYLWLKDERRTDFHDVHDALMAQQERKLVNNGLLDKYSAPIARLLLMNHGYADKQDLHSTGKMQVVIGDKDADTL